MNALAGSASGWQVARSTDLPGIKCYVSCTSNWSRPPFEIFGRQTYRVESIGDDRNWIQWPAKDVGTLRDIGGRVAQFATKSLYPLPQWRSVVERRLWDIVFATERENPLVPIEVALQASRESAQLLPNEMPVPAVVPTDDGAIELEWRKARRHLRIAFFGSDSYVWIDNAETGEYIHGSLARLRDQTRRTLEMMSTP